MWREGMWREAREGLHVETLHCNVSGAPGVRDVGAQQRCARTGSEGHGGGAPVSDDQALQGVTRNRGPDTALRARASGISAAMSN